MILATNAQHRAQNFKLKPYSNNTVKNCSVYADLINCMPVTVETDSCRKGDAKYGYPIPRHLVGRYSIDIKVMSNYAKDAFYLLLNQLSNRLKNSVRHKKSLTVHSRF